jgi:hypothetical protein
MIDSALFGPHGDQPFRIYSDGPSRTCAGLWQYQSESREDALDCAWDLFLAGDYAAVYVKEQGVEIFRVDDDVLAGTSARRPRSRTSELAR